MFNHKKIKKVNNQELKFATYNKMIHIFNT